jgi:cell division protein FtsN
MYSWVRSTPGKTASVKSVSVPVKTDVISGTDAVQSPAGILAKQNITFDPGKVSYTELAQNNITISDPVAFVATEANSAQPDYFIIGGAFRDQNNAIKLIGILQDQGYPAAIVDTTPGGLYMVSMKGFSDYTEAAKQLDAIKKAGFESSWIFKKQRS